MTDRLLCRAFSRRATMYYVIIAFSASIAAFLAGYLAILVARILSRGIPTSIGFDVILGFHALAALAIISAFFARGISINRVWFYLAILSGFVEIVFLSLNISGFVWRI